MVRAKEQTEVATFCIHDYWLCVIEIFLRPSNLGSLIEFRIGSHRPWVLLSMPCVGSPLHTNKNVMSSCKTKLFSTDHST